jgi:hypothetical protein
MAEAGEIVLAPEEEPDNWFEDAEFAFRISTVRHGFDLALLYYNGYTDDPVYHRDYLTDGRMRFTPHYHRYQAYGFNFAKGFERATVRGEIAIKPGLLFSIDSNYPSYDKDSECQPAILLRFHRKRPRSPCRKTQDPRHHL